MRYFGVEAGPSFIRAAIVEKGVRTAKILRLASAGLSGEESGYSAALGEFLARLEYNKEKDILSVVFPGDKITWRSFATPLVKRSQIAETLPFELESRTPLSAEEFTAGFIITEKKKEGSQALALLAKNADVASFLSIFESAGLDPDMLAPGPLASAAGLPRRLFSSVPGQSTAVAHGGASGAYITIVNHEGTPLAFHACGLGAAQNESVPREIDRLFLGLSREAADIKLVAAALGGGFEDITALAENLKDKFHIPALPVDWDEAPEPELEGYSPSPAARKALFLSALGAARMAAEEQEWVNFRSGRFKKTAHHARLNREALTAGALLACALAVGAAIYVGEGVRMRMEHAGLKNEIRNIFKSAMPETTNIVSEKQQLLAELARLEKASGALGAAGGVDPFLSLLRDVSLAKPENARLDIEIFALEPGRLILSGRTESFERVDQFKANLEKLKWTAKARLDKAKTAGPQGDVSFRIEVDVSF